MIDDAETAPVSSVSPCAVTQTPTLTAEALDVAVVVYVVSPVTATVTSVVVASAFYPAEGYHQDYYLTNPLRYKFYRTSCGRDKRLEQVWGAAAK